MKNFLSLLLALALIFTIVGCRGNATPEDFTSNKSNNEIANTSSESYRYCQHTITTIKNQVDVNCIDNGYTGDTVCAKCNVIIAVGEIVSAMGHDTEIHNQKNATTTSIGYTGDICCKVCNIVIATGDVIPKIKVKHTTDSGYVYSVDADVDITEYSMKQQTKYIDSPYRETELEILDLCNKERAKMGIAPLEWYEDAYYFTHIRSCEIYYNWDHKRPDGSDWHTVYTNADVIINEGAENLAQQLGGDNIAAGTVDAWMNSNSGHRESILNPNFTKMAVAITYGEDTFTLSVAQHFFN